MKTAKVATAAILGALTVAGLTSLPAYAKGPGRPVYLTGGGHSCSYTNPEYMLSDYDMAVRPSPGSTAFTATWTPGHKPWEDAYWVTGFHDENSNICNTRELPGSHGKYGKSLTLPVKVSRQILITADLRASGAGRLGFDLWFSADTRETGPRMVEPGSGGIFRDNPGWHRVYMAVLPEHYGAVSFRGLDLTRFARDAGVPGSDYWMAVDAGAETTSGSFTVDSYALHISGQHPKPAPKTFRATAIAKVTEHASALAWRKATERVTVLYRNVRVTAASTATARDEFVSTATVRRTATVSAPTRARAVEVARSRARAAATSAARSAARRWATRGARRIALHRAQVAARKAAGKIALHEAVAKWNRMHVSHQRAGKS